MRKLSALLFLALSLNLLSGETPIPAAPSGWVTDAAGFMSAPAARALDARLGAYERSSGRQVFVYLGKTTGGVPIEDWAVKAFKTWKVGQKGLDNGVVLFVMSDDRRLRIEVGYGLEGTLTDSKSVRIIDDIIKPRILAGDRDGAVTAGAEAIVNTLDGKPLSGAAGTGTGVSAPLTPAAPRAPSKAPISFLEFIFYAFLAIVFLAILVTHPNFALYLLINILSSSSRGGSYSSGGGGFSGGGGGRSGGGGASGSW